MRPGRVNLALNPGGKVGKSLSEKTEAVLLALCPDFRLWWDGERDLWADDKGKFTTHGLFGVLSHSIADKLSHGPASDLAAVFEYVESELEDSDSEVSNTV